MSRVRSDLGRGLKKRKGNRDREVMDRFGLNSKCVMFKKDSCLSVSCVCVCVCVLCSFERQRIRDFGGGI